MASFKIIVALAALCIVLSVAAGQAPQGGPHTNQGGSGTSQGGTGTSQGGPHENQGRTKRQAAQSGGDQNDDSEDNTPVWTTCEFNVVGSKLSCSDCHTRVICTPVGGVVKPCQNPFRPYCNNGLCSTVPSVECA